MTRWVLAVERDALWEGEKLGLSVEGTPVLLVNVSGEIRAYLDRCPHLGSRMSEGDLQEGVLRCRSHQWTFDSLTGHGINPRCTTLQPLPARISDEGIEVLLETA